jgi:hypothetical protein
MHAVQMRAFSHSVMGSRIPFISFLSLMNTCVHAVIYTCLHKFIRVRSRDHEGVDARVNAVDGEVSATRLQEFAPGPPQRRMRYGKYHRTLGTSSTPGESLASTPLTADSGRRVASFSPCCGQVPGTTRPPPLPPTTTTPLAGSETGNRHGSWWLCPGCPCCARRTNRAGRRTWRLPEPAERVSRPVWRSAGQRCHPHTRRWRARS